MKDSLISGLDWNKIDAIIENALQEDVGDGDITTNSLFNTGETAKAYIKVKEAGTIAGLPIAERVFLKLDNRLSWNAKIVDGEQVLPGQILSEIEGSQRALLTGERLALNILQRLSGIATQTAKYLTAVKGLPVKILDTRKTLPGLRVLEKYAVAAGGGKNHRFGLFDGIMIKDNHIKLAGGITNAVNKIKKAGINHLSIEVETSNLAEVNEALNAGADIIMLDNMSLEKMREAVQRIEGEAKTEASGGITLEKIRKVAETGVDYISVGALTHSVKALDIGMYFYG